MRNYDYTEFENMRRVMRGEVRAIDASPDREKIRQYIELLVREVRVPTRGAGRQKEVPLVIIYNFLHQATAFGRFPRPGTARPVDNAYAAQVPRPGATPRPRVERADGGFSRL